MKVKVFIVATKKKIGTFNLIGIPVDKRNATPVTIGIEVDQNGILNLWAKIKCLKGKQVTQLNTTTFCLAESEVLNLANELKHYTII
jgi:molecular chaperone DnaK (HSP70)